MLYVFNLCRHSMYVCMHACMHACIYDSYTMRKGYYIESNFMVRGGGRTLLIASIPLAQSQLLVIYYYHYRPSFLGGIFLGLDNKDKN